MSQEEAASSKKKTKIASKMFVISQVVKFLPHLSKKNLLKILSLYEKIASGQPREVVRMIIKLFNDSVAGDFILRAAKLTNSKARKAIATTLIADGFILRDEARRRTEAEGSFTPTSLLISPTMRCNLRCKGCYAGNYSQKDDLPYEVVDRVVTEGKEMGVALVTILGGEPLIWERLFDLFAAHQNMYFQFYTNGTLLSEDKVKKIRDLGNVAVILSIEGFKKETDERRQAGVYDKVLKAMDLLRKHKVPFGYSVAVTKDNEAVITSDEFVDLMIEKGALIGWLFMYMPVGKDPDLNLMPTPEQRRHLLDFDRHIRQTRPLFIVDFWNDAPFVGGCIAGKFYAHITSSGLVEPCIFTHLAKDNIKEKSLKEVMSSEFFKEMRRRQPYNDNLYLPCMWIDHPEVSRDLHAKFNLTLTHPGADDVLVKDDLRKGVEEYSHKVKELYGPEWEKEKQLSAAQQGAEDVLLRIFGKE
ncbi:MAG: radical SAM protein [Patescibacteria group bacterium]